MIPGKDVAQIQQARNGAIDDNVYLTLEATQPGLGSAWANWLVENSDKMAETFLQSVSPQYQGILGPQIKDKSATIGNNMIAARNRQELTAQKKVAEYLTGRADPQFMNALLLQSDSTLAPDQRQMVYDKIIAPIIDQGKKAGWSPAQTMENIDKFMSQIKPEDKVLAAALKKHLGQRFVISSNINRWMNEFTIRSTSPIQRNWLNVGIRQTLDPRNLVDSFSNIFTGKRGNAGEPPGLDTVNLARSELGWAYGSAPTGPASH
jgi:hypothetical protein